MLTCICPQQVCPGGNTTSCPSRSSSSTVARPAAGATASTRQVRNSAIRTCTSQHGSVGRISTDQSGGSVASADVRRSSIVSGAASGSYSRSSESARMAAACAQGVVAAGGPLLGQQLVRPVPHPLLVRIHAAILPRRGWQQPSEQPAGPGRVLAQRPADRHPAGPDAAAGVLVVAGEPDVPDDQHQHRERRPVVPEGGADAQVQRPAPAVLEHDPGAEQDQPGAGGQRRVELLAGVELADRQPGGTPVAAAQPVPVDPGPPVEQPVVGAHRPRRPAEQDRHRQREPGPDVDLHDQRPPADQLGDRLQVERGRGGQAGQPEHGGGLVHGPGPRTEPGQLTWGHRCARSTGRPSRPRRSRGAPSSRARPRAVSSIRSSHFSDL